MTCRADRSRGSEHGSAVSEFAMVSGLVVFLFLAVMQIGLALHVRNTLTLAASEGARAGARLDASPEMGVARAREIVTGSLSPRFAQDIRASTASVDGVAVVVVTIRSPIPVIGPIGPERALTVTGRAFEEAQ
ncbi:MAG: TadE family protein [Dermatophilaceae bacterium]|nr:pilus assembly protein [Intrasporangiaceae bacterium]